MVLAAGIAGRAPAVGALATAVDWPTFGYGVDRTGYNPNEATLDASTAPGLHKLWSFDLGAVSVAQPIFAAGVTISGTPHDVVYAASEHGMLYALDAATMAVLWSRDLGSQDTSCADMPDTIFGISGAPTLDRAANRLYVVGGNGKVYALSVSTGATAPNWPIAVTKDPAHEHVYGGVTLWNGKLYVATASYCDIAPYHGHVTEIDVATRTKVKTWYPAGLQVDGGGIWGPGGVSVDPATGHVFAATGNALTNPESYRYSERVVELDASLTVLGSNYPGLTGGDVDFGATPILYQRNGCPPQVAAENKSGVLVVYTRGHISSGYTQRLQVASVGDWRFTGIPAFEPTTNILYVSNSSDSGGTYMHGLVAFKVRSTCKLQMLWQATVGPNGSNLSPPTVANGVVYYGDGSGKTVRAFDALTGHPLWNSGATITGAVYAAPTVVNGSLYVATWDHHLYAFGP